MDTKGFLLVTASLGVVMLAAAATGGGLDVLQIKIPEIRRFSRFASGLLGLVFVFAALVGWSMSLPDTGTATPVAPPVAASTSLPTQAPVATPRVTALAAPETRTAPPTQPTESTILSTIGQPVSSRPLHAINAGVWNHDLVVVSNTCGAGAPRGQHVPYSFSAVNASRTADYIADGDQVNALVLLGPTVTTTLAWPTLAFEYAFAGGYALYYAEFFDSQAGWARLETYNFVPAGTCAIVGEESRPVGFIPLFEKH